MIGLPWLALHWPDRGVFTRKVIPLSSRLDINEKSHIVIGGHEPIMKTGGKVMSEGKRAIGYVRVSTDEQAREGAMPPIGGRFSLPGGWVAYLSLCQLGILAST